MAIAVWAVFAFVVLKSMFGFIGWYSRDDFDAIHRRQLVALWEQLAAGSFFDFIQLVQRRLVARLRDTFDYPSEDVWNLATVGLAINIIAILGAAELFEMIAAYWPAHVYSFELELREARPDYYLGKGVQILFRPGWAPMGPLEPILTNVVLLPFGVAFGLLSMWVSWKLLQRASQSQSLATVLVHLAINLAMVATAMLFVNLIHAGTYLLVMRWLAPADFESNVSSLQFFWSNSVIFVNILADLVRFRLPYELTLFEVRGVCFATSLVLPTFVYGLICGVALLARLAPRALQRFVTRCIRLVTSDKQPVFTQLGYVAGTIAAIIAALIAALKGS